MCKYCDPESDDFDWIDKSIDLGDFGMYVLDVSISPRFENLIIEASPEGSDPIWRENIKITYCPFCGRRLKKEPKKQS